jgi:hypothetical protein
MAEIKKGPAMGMKKHYMKNNKADPLFIPFPGRNPFWGRSGNDIDVYLFHWAGNPVSGAVDRFRKIFRKA